jgi:hypothetical protein
MPSFPGTSLSLRGEKCTKKTNWKKREAKFTRESSSLLANLAQLPRHQLVTEGEKSTKKLFENRERGKIYARKLKFARESGPAALAPACH